MYKNSAGFTHLLVIFFLLVAIVIGIFIMRNPTYFNPYAANHVTQTSANPIDEPTIHHVLITGQSLAVGALGWPPLSTTQPYSNLMLSSNLQPETASFVPLTAFYTAEEAKFTETIAAGMANSVTAAVENNNYQMLMTVNGLGLQLYNTLKKGSPTYSLALAQMNAAKKLSIQQNKKYRVDAVVVLHGESDNHFGNGPFYKNYLSEWINDYNQDIKTITGQTDDVPMLVDQISSWTKLGTSSSLNAPHNIPLAQLEASEENPSHIFLVAPNYFLDYKDGLHLTNISYRRLGEYFGKVYKKVVVDKQPWRPLSPKSIIISGNVITVKFFTPVPPIAIDTVQVMAKENYGFEYYDESASAVIDSVKVTDADTVEITLNKVPKGNNKRLRYAYTGTLGSWAGNNQAGSPRGNIRDSDLTRSLYGYSLNNWLVHFDKPISDASMTTPPIGIFDGVYGNQLIGWACDLDVPATAPYVHIYIDDQFGWVATADKKGAAGIGTNCEGYENRRIITDIPEKYKDGNSHSVKIYAIDNANGMSTLLNGSPKTFNLQHTTGVLTATSRVCQVPRNNKNCGLDGPEVSWNVTNPTGDVIIKIRETNQGFAGGAPSGTAKAWFVTNEGVTLDLYTGTTLLHSLKLKGYTDE